MDKNQILGLLGMFGFVILLFMALLGEMLFHFLQKRGFSFEELKKKIVFASLSRLMHLMHKII